MKISNQQQWRLNLGQQQDLLQLSLIAVFTGILVSFVIIVFRLSIDVGQRWLTGSAENGQFEQLTQWQLLFIPVMGALAIASILHFLPVANRKTGIPFVINAIAKHKSKISWVNTAVQFLVAAIALITGQSVGKEGPAVHLGAGSASLLAHHFRLGPTNSRVVLACGVAAAIAASFNTPIAAVIFALEVILMEYTILGFMPIIIAAITASYMVSLIYPVEALIPNLGLTLQQDSELVYLIGCGFVIAALAGMFNQSIRYLLHFQTYSLFLRLGFAGLLTGFCALALPEVMGAGYDSVQLILTDSSSFYFLLGLLAVKMLCSTVSIGLGMPAGLIGPTLVIGACAGAICGLALPYIFADSQANPVFYALLGMAAMMAATLQAPLAALIAVLELSSSTDIILPALFLITVANLSSQFVFKQPSIFLSILQQQGLTIAEKNAHSAVKQTWLSELGNQDFNFLTGSIHLQSIAKSTSNWLVINNNNHLFLVDKTHLINLIQERSLNQQSDLVMTDLLQGCYRLILLEHDQTLTEVISELNQLDVAGFLLSIDQKMLVTRQQIITFLSK